mgnify:CR=1 FL=1
MVCRGLSARPCELVLEQGGTEMGDDVPMVKVVIRGFSGAMQIVEHSMMVKSPAIAWEYAAAYFGTEAAYSECDRYTVDTYWVY